LANSAATGHEVTTRSPAAIAGAVKWIFVVTCFSWLLKMFGYLNFIQVFYN
jgi:hypothetical protein